MTAFLLAGAAFALLLVGFGLLRDNGRLRRLLDDALRGTASRPERTDFPSGGGV